MLDREEPVAGDMIRPGRMYEGEFDGWVIRGSGLSKGVRTNGELTALGRGIVMFEGARECVLKGADGAGFGDGEVRAGDDWLMPSNKPASWVDTDLAEPPVLCRFVRALVLSADTWSPPSLELAI